MISPATVDRIYTTDIFMHTWDLARATGQDDRLDPASPARSSRAWSRWRRSCAVPGSSASRVPVPDDADAQTRLLGFIGRDPDWKP